MIRCAAALAVLFLAAGCSSAGSTGALPTGGSSHARVGTSRASSALSPTRATSRNPVASPALALLAQVQVKGRAPMTGYDRAQYGQAWTDDNDDEDGHNGCDTRNDVLRRDLVSTSIDPSTHGCVVLSGVLRDQYTNTTIDFTRGVGTSLAVQIDHVVALGDSWQTGAQAWSEAKRVDLANDPLNLLAVDGPANESKGDGDAATWLPPNKAFRCQYVARQTAVKVRYGLWMTSAEHDAIARVLASCPGQTAPTDGTAAPAETPGATGVTSTQPPTTSAPARPPVVGAREFANCTDLHGTYPHGVGRPGAHDQTSGVPDTQFVVSAALYAANAKSDGDGDGIACEA